MSEDSPQYFDHAECPFCPPDSRRVIAQIGSVTVLWDGFPVSEGHALVVPTRHVSSWNELTVQEQVAFVGGVNAARAVIAEKFNPDGYNIGINDGEAAGQTVMHLHLHVIPRYHGDSPDPRGGIRWVVPGKACYWKPDSVEG